MDLTDMKSIKIARPKLKDCLVVERRNMQDILRKHKTYDESSYMVEGMIFDNHITVPMEDYYLIDIRAFIRFSLLIREDPTSLVMDLFEVAFCLQLTRPMAYEQLGAKILAEEYEKADPMIFQEIREKRVAKAREKRLKEIEEPGSKE